jgi:hypothetical protein
MNTNAVRIVNRAADMAGAYGHTRVAPERVDALALAKLTVEHVRQEVALFIRYVYQKDGAGRWLYIGADGMIPAGVWCPWGGSGKASLTRSQRDIMRRWLLCQQRDRNFPAFFYRPKARRWHVDILRYDSEAAALSWLARCPLDGAVWLATDGR